MSVPTPGDKTVLSPALLMLYLIETLKEALVLAERGGGLGVAFSKSTVPVLASDLGRVLGGVASSKGGRGLVGVSPSGAGGRFGKRGAVPWESKT